MPMRVLLGPPGSGKTTQVLHEFLLASRSSTARLVVPTATMASHLQHQLAREGQPVSPSSITTLARFASSLAPGAPAADSATLSLLVEEQLHNHPTLFPAAQGTAGLPAAIAAAIEELANSGCGSLQWLALAEQNRRTFEPAFGKLYEDVERALSSAGLRLRATLLLDAAERVREQGARTDQVWLDGFTLFSKTELVLLEAIASRARLTLTLPEWEGVEDLIQLLKQRGARVERLQTRRATPEVLRIRSATREREVEEITLRILEEHSRGRPWREMGIVLHNESAYLPLLERTLYRAGIPCRAYFGAPLQSEPVTSLFRRFTAAVTSRWEGEACLDLLRHPLCRSSRGITGEPWKRAIEALPFQGLDKLRKLTAAADSLLPFADWSGRLLSPAEWARELASLASLLEPPPANGAIPSHRLGSVRLTAAGFRAILDAASSIPHLLPPDPVELAEFWEHVEDAIAEARLWHGDACRDVVHILDVQEARQWELPVVFVCGLLEGEFPRRSGPDPLLPETLRLALRQNGFPLRTRAEREQEERFHFEIARTRATKRLFLSWPSANEKGDPTLPSFLLDPPGTGQDSSIPARRLRIRPECEPRRAPRPSLQSDSALNAVRSIHSKLRATAIESFLQCPFQFYARHTLRLQPLPARPAERIDQLWLGTLAHQILAEWHNRRCDIAKLVDEFWDRELCHSGVAETHQTILERAIMKRALSAYAADPGLRDGWDLRLEESLQLAEAGVEIHGRADRVDVSPQGECIVYDFKYSGAQSVRSRESISVQGGLYAEALARNENLRPAGICFIALKDDAERTGAKDAAQAQEKIAGALEKTRTAIGQIHQGRIDVAPALGDLCQWCEFLDSCRWQELAPARAAAGEGEG